MVVQKRFMLEISKITKVMVKENSAWRVVIVTRVGFKMIATRDLARTIVLMADTDKAYMFLAIFRAKEELHIPMAAFKWECLLRMNLKEK